MRMVYSRVGALNSPQRVVYSTGVGIYYAGALGYQNYWYVLLLTIDLEISLKDKVRLTKGSLVIIYQGGNPGISPLLAVEIFEIGSLPPTSPT